MEKSRVIEESYSKWNRPGNISLNVWNEFNFKKWLKEKIRKKKKEKNTCKYKIKSKKVEL